MFKKCIEACEKAIVINPNYKEAYNNICSAYSAMGQFKEAVEACEKSLVIDPNYTRAKNNLLFAQKQLKSIKNE